MSTVMLIIVFLSAAAGVEQSVTMEMRDMATCESVADGWRRWPGGALRVMSARCVGSDATVAQGAPAAR